MIIYIINQYAVPDVQAGPTRHFNLARQLTQMGHTVYIIASSFDHILRKETKSWVKTHWLHEQFSGVNFVWIRTPSYSGNTMKRYLNMFSFAAIIWINIRKYKIQHPDVIIGSSPHLLAALAAERLARRFGVPFILEVRDLWPQSMIDLINVSEWHPFIRFLSYIERYLYKHASSIITLLPASKQYIGDKGANRGKIHWIPNGVDLSLVPQPKLKAKNNYFNVMYAGTHGLANALESIIDAAAIVQKARWGKAVRFCFIGDGPEKPKLLEKVKQEKIKNVIFQNAVSKRDLYKILVKADIFIVNMKSINLYKYGISFNKIYDYLACARPTIIGSSSSNNPIQESHSGITVQPEDSQAMADAIKQLTELNDLQRWQMGLNGRKLVQEHYDFQILAQKLERIILNTIKKSTS